MSADQFARYAEKREMELLKQYRDDVISREEYNNAMRELQQEAREAYQQDCDDALERIRDEWSW